MQNVYLKCCKSLFFFSKCHVVGHFRKAYLLARLFHLFSKRIIQTHVRKITRYVTKRESSIISIFDSIDYVRCPRERGKLFGNHVDSQSPDPDVNKALEAGRISVGITSRGPPSARSAAESTVRASLGVF